MNGALHIASPVRKAIPGFRGCLTFTLIYLSLIVLIPLLGLFYNTAQMTYADFWSNITAPQTLAAFRVSFTAAFIAALINAIFGTIVAWVLVRYSFPGKQFVDALVDLPFALPTAVAGIALSALYAPTSWLGGILATVGLQVAYTPRGIVVAMIFIGLPFVVRTVEPILKELDPQFEEAAASLGASRLQVLRKIVLPQMIPGILTGFAMAFARGLGEYGSVIFIAGNLPMISQIVPLLIVIELEEFQYEAATALAMVMLLVSFVLLLAINLLQKWHRSYAEEST